MELRIKEGLAYRRVAGEVFIVDAASSRLHELNGPAAVIWEGLAAGRGRAAAVRGLTAEFEVDEGAAGADYDAFVEELKEAGLISAA